ncbi:MAG TPA: hypothetical protein VN903_17390 [Polyangia bacterium]|jgi:hypothetical protein|nr:hypothetical protein [Polyangia bacterium]
MWRRLLEVLGRGCRYPAGAAAACRALEAKHPDVEAIDVWLRARAPGRDVVAVLYRDRRTKFHRGMPRYQLYAVRPDHSVEELVVDGASPYHVRGIK